MNLLKLFKKRTKLELGGVYKNGYDQEIKIFQINHPKGIYGGALLVDNEKTGCCLDYDKYGRLIFDNKLENLIAEDE